MILSLIAALAQAGTAAPPKPVLAYPKTEAISCAIADTAESLSCRAVEASQQHRFTYAAGLFEQASAKSNDPLRRDQALAAAGNMWIAAAQPRQAAAALDRAIAGGTLKAEQQGLALLDRARAAEAQGDVKTARAKVNEAANTISADPYLWFFSAALAVREDDIPAAKSAINRALAMVPDSPEVMFEAGHIAKAAGEDAVARDYWTKTIAADPNGPAGRAAREALAMTEVPIIVTNEVAKHPNGDGEEGKQN